MVRSVLGFAIFAVVTIVALKLLLGLLGVVIGLVATVLWFALIGFGMYLILKVVDPGTAERLRAMITGDVA